MPLDARKKPPVIVTYDVDVGAWTDGLARALANIGDERFRQHSKWGDQAALPDGTGPSLRDDAVRARKDVADAMEAGALTWRHILIEEVAEACGEQDPAALRAELVQVAAVATQWIEALDRRAGR